MNEDKTTAAWLVGLTAKGGILLQIADLPSGAAMTITMPPKEAKLIATQLLLQIEHSQAEAAPKQEAA